MIDLNEAPEQRSAFARHAERVSERALRSLNNRSAEIARALLGPENPAHSSVSELRWGTNGSISVEVAGPKAGAYYNHERKLGGGLMQMLAIEGGMTTGAAVDWLRNTLGIELEREKPRKSLNERIVATYDYRDESGALLFQVARLAEPKDFRQRRPDGAGGWEWSVKGTRLVPYRLPELLAAPDAPVFVVEGEKDADRLASLGLVATCNPGGVGKWSAEFRDLFIGRDVVIVPDNDKAGREHAALVARSLAGAAVRVRVIELPGLGPKDDVSDWLDADGTREALERLIEEAGAVAPPVAMGDLVDLDAPYLIARQFIARHYTTDGVVTLRHHRELFFAWSGAAYREISTDALRARLYAWLDLCTELDGKGKTHPVKPDRRLVGDVFDALRAVAHLDDAIVAPCWIEGVGSAPADELIACANGLLHLPTRRLLPHSPLFFTPNALEFGFDEAAEPPVEWLRFLGQIWPDDPASVETLQEIFGLTLTADTRHQKAFLLIGPQRSGKGTIARVLARLVGLANVAAPTLAGLTATFGLAPLIGKRLAIIADARLGSRTDQAVVAERLLSITGEDAMTVERKFLSSWTGKLQTRIVILSNELPRIGDASGALANRFIVLEMVHSFLGKEDHELTDRLLGELPEILNWAIEGWKRLNRRGYFVQPESAMESTSEMADLGSPVSAFVREHCEIGEGYSVARDDLYKSWCWWCEAQGRDKPGTKNTFGRDLRAAFPYLRTSRPRVGEGDRERRYEGVRLKPVVHTKWTGIDLNEAPLQRDEGDREPWWIH